MKTVKRWFAALFTSPDDEPLITEDDVQHMRDVADASEARRRERWDRREPWKNRNALERELISRKRGQHGD